LLFTRYMQRHRSVSYFKNCNWFDILKMLEAPSLSIKLPDYHRILEQRGLE